MDAETYVSYSEVEDDDNVWDNAKAVSLFANASISYDYYLDAFGRMGYNGNNTAMYLYFNYPDTDGNAYSKVNLVFTGTDNPIETDTIVHEFTHSVSGSIVHWSEYKGETGALNEGYSDVMAFCQAETSTWVRTNGRYAADPNSKKQPASVGDEYWGDPNDEDDDHGSVHKNSTVVSHVAYLMHESGLSFDEIEQIWYSSLFYLLSDASFQDFANALSSAAMDLGFTDDDLNAISSALSEAGLTVTQKLEKDDESSNESGSSAVSTNVVLVLDTSGSMAGEPVEAIKQAASTFVETAFDSENVQVGLVQFNSEGNIESDFTRDADTLDTAISTFSGVGDTNTEDGLIKAQNLLANSMASRNIVVLMTDGYPNDGCEGEEVSARLKDRGVLLFTLGYFAANDPDAAAAQQYLEGMASPGYHYEVTSTASLEAFFAEMAEQITGVKLMYIQVAGDVGVTVSKDGETLATDGSGEASRTSFGSLTYVRTEDAQTGGGDSGSDSSSGSSSSSSSSSQDSSTASMTKVLRLHEGDSYDVVISANSSGNMSYEIGYVDDSGEYTDFRTFEGISMTADSVASAVAETGTDSYLRVDSDGDGVVDETYHAAANSVGARVDNSMLVSLSLGMSAAITVALVSIVVLVETNRKRKGERI